MSFQPFNWTCAVCGQPTTIVEANFDSRSTYLDCRVTPKGQAIAIHGRLIECPNPNCRAQHVTVSAHYGIRTDANYGSWVKQELDRPVGVGTFTFAPGAARPLSPYVPASVSEDFVEANLILQLSPKSAATLARRALQGMIRDFWKVSKGTLAEELSLIKDACDHDLYQAMMGLKAIGNIGAHPERDINLVISIDSGEAEELLELIRLLDQEWYVSREKKKQRLASVQALAEAKKVEKG